MAHVTLLSLAPSFRPRLACAVALGSALALSACGGDGKGNSNPDATDAGPNGGPDASIENVPDQTTYVKTLIIPEVDGDTVSCCYDFGEISKNGVGELDNGFAALAAQAESLADQDFQANIDENLESGGQVILFNHVGLSSDTDSFRVDGLLGDFEGATTYAEASAGTGTFTVKPSSYDGNGDALIQLSGDMESGAMSAGPANFALTIPIGDAIVSVNVSQTRLSGDATLGSTGVSYENGKLSGYILQDDLYGAINAWAASECTCLEIEGDLFLKGQDGTWEGNCDSNAEDHCGAESNCSTVGSTVCGALPLFVGLYSDIDTNDDTSIYEGLSVGFEWTGAEATIVQ